MTHSDCLKKQMAVEFLKNRCNVKYQIGLLVTRNISEFRPEKLELKALMLQTSLSMKMQTKVKKYLYFLKNFTVDLKNLLALQKNVPKK